MSFLQTSTQVRRTVQGVVAALAVLGALLATTSPAQAATAAPGACSSYTVQSGDYLSAIASQAGLSSWQGIADVNHLANPNLLVPGQQLALCGATSAVVNAGTAQVSASQQYSAADTDWAKEPCRSTTYTTGPIYMWKVPPGCYAGVYWINANNYVSRPGFGWCNWWPEVLHPNRPNILDGVRHSTPIPGAVAVFAPGEQGASSAGHYGEVVAVLGNGWILISEMNNTWRGAGFGRVNYRYVQEDAGVTYIY